MSRDELLKPIWHAFTALDVDRSGKVSKSQLKVLSHNLCTVLKVPHDPVSLEEHFKDDDEGPVSNQGYMPYLSTFILDKVRDFNRLELNHMCWTLCCKKNLDQSQLQVSEYDAFKLWCIFNFLSEEHYPLVLVSQEMEYLLHKLCEAMGGSWVEQGLSVWELLRLMGAGLFKNIHRHTLSMGISEVYQELILDVLKQGFMQKKGHKRKNWTERWFVLKPDCISYFTGEDQQDKKGDIPLDGNCFVESLPDKDGKKCLFLVKSSQKTFEISASDKKKKQEWIQAIQMVAALLRQRRPAPHREARQKRREQRMRLQDEQMELELRMSELTTANEAKQRELEDLRKALEEAAANAAEEERRRVQTQTGASGQVPDRPGEREDGTRERMELEMAQKSTELQSYLQRVKELEDLYQQLEGALDEERRARQDEEAVRKLQSRILEEESLKRAELEQIHLNQQRRSLRPEAQNQELQKERLAKEAALQDALKQLDELAQERQGLEQYQTVMKKLENATNKTKTWKHKVAEHEGLLRLIQPGSKGPVLVTNWGPAAISEQELNHREKEWQEKKMHTPGLSQD
uniref:Switch-associated protein 70 n=1 Tax=Neogobius melanostomus TaxID=47308 RepID=A0A8C6T7H9_9GOBI